MAKVQLSLGIRKQRETLAITPRLGPLPKRSYILSRHTTGWRPGVQTHELGGWDVLHSKQNSDVTVSRTDEMFSPSPTTKIKLEKCLNSQFTEF